MNYVIENKKGSYKSFIPEGEETTYPLRGVTYPVDYGYINGYIGEDDAELDLFIGTGNLKGYIKVWRLDVPVETKFFTEVSRKELAEILLAFEPVLLDSKVLTDTEFENELNKFKVK
jgi:hypothetical protein